MIWSITSKKEMVEMKTSSVFRYYQEALGKDNIQLFEIQNTSNDETSDEDGI